MKRANEKPNHTMNGRWVTHCRSCGAKLNMNYGDDLCHTCFVSRGLEAVVELLSSQVQQSLFESLIALSKQAHHREQTDVAFHALSAAYHAAYHPDHFAIIINEAKTRVAEWVDVLDECGDVRAENYQHLAEEAYLLQGDMAAAMAETEA